MSGPKTESEWRSLLMRLTQSVEQQETLLMDLLRVLPTEELFRLLDHAKAASAAADAAGDPMRPEALTALLGVFGVRYAFQRLLQERVVEKFGDHS